MEHMNIVGHPYQSKQQLASACSEIIEDLLRKTYDEENPFERFNEVLPSYGPNTLENSLSIEQREQTDTENTNYLLDGSNDVVYRRDLDASNSLVQSINSLRGSCGDNHERHNYVSHCLHSMVNNNVKTERTMDKYDEESFDGDYLENLRGQNENIIAESASDKGLPDTLEEYSDDERFEMVEEDTIEEDKVKCTCKKNVVVKRRKGLGKKKRCCKKTVEINEDEEYSDCDESCEEDKVKSGCIKINCKVNSVCKKNDVCGECSPKLNPCQNVPENSLTIMKPKKVSFEETSSSHLQIGITDSERELLILMDNAPSRRYSFTVQEDTISREDSRLLDELSMQNGLFLDSMMTGNGVEDEEIYRLEGLYAQGDIKRFEEFDTNVSVEVSFGICTKIVAFFLTINTLFLMKYLIVDVALAHLPL